MTETVIVNLTDSYGFFRENVGRTLGDLKLEYQTRFPKFTASSNFDQLISDQISFEDSWIYQKIKNLLYVPICKVDNDPDKWYIQSAYHVQINEGVNFSDS